MITHVQLKDFRSHALTNLALAPFTLFLGPMGAGKSSVLHAIAMTLLGQDPLSNARGEGIGREIRVGENEFHLAVKLDTGSVVERKFAEGRHSVGIDGQYAGVKQQQGRILERLKCSADVVLALLDPTPFFSRDEKAQRGVLLQFMSQKEVAAPPLVKKLRLAESFQSVGQIDLLIKEIKENKVRTLNREIDILQKRIPEITEFDVNRKKGLADELVGLRSRRDDLIGRESREQEWRRTLEKLSTSVQAAEKDGSLADFQVAAAKAAENESEARKSLVELKRQYKDLSLRAQETQDEKTKWESDKGRTEGMLATVGGMGEKCGVVDLFDCPLKEADKKKMRQQLEDDLKEMREGLEVLNSEAEDLRTKLADLEVSGKAQAATIESLVKARSEIAAKVARLEEATSSLKQHELNPPETGNWVKELGKVADKVASAEIDLVAIEKTEEEAVSRALQIADVRAKQVQAEELKAAAEELGKVKDGLLAQASGGFVDAMRGFLGKFGFKEVEFRSDPFGFVVDGLYADQLSGGQKVVFEAALRLAAAKSSGLEMMALDDANKLGEKARQKMAGALAGAGVQVIVCSTTEIEPVNSQPLPKGMAIYWFENPSVIGPTTVRKLG